MHALSSRQSFFFSFSLPSSTLTLCVNTGSPPLLTTNNRSLAPPPAAWFGPPLSVTPPVFSRQDGSQEQARKVSHGENMVTVLFYFFLLKRGEALFIAIFCCRCSLLTTLHSGHPVLPPTPLADPSPYHPLRSHPFPAPAPLPPSLTGPDWGYVADDR